jgi:hypothetical protein
MAQVVKCLPSKNKALNSNPSTAKKKNNRGSMACRIISRNVTYLLLKLFDEWGKSAKGERWKG